MANDEEVINSPTSWVKKHIEEYIATDGAQGHDWRGYPTLLLTTTGCWPGATSEGTCALICPGPT